MNDYIPEEQARGWCVMLGALQYFNRFTVSRSKRVLFHLIGDSFTAAIVDAFVTKDPVSTYMLLLMC